MEEKMVTFNENDPNRAKDFAGMSLQMCAGTAILWTKDTCMFTELEDGDVISKNGDSFSVIPQWAIKESFERR